MTRLCGGVAENPKCAATVESHLSKNERWGTRGLGSVTGRGGRGVVLCSPQRGGGKVCGVRGDFTGHGVPSATLRASSSTPFGFRLTSLGMTELGMMGSKSRFPSTPLRSGSPACAVLGVGMTRLWGGAAVNPKCAAAVEPHLSKNKRWGTRGLGLQNSVIQRAPSHSFQRPRVRGSVSDHTHRVPCPVQALLGRGCSVVTASE